LASIIAKLASRIGLCKLTYRGELPQFTWADVCSMMITPNRKWPTHKLAIPFDDQEPEPRFDTPLGVICWDTRNRRNLGFLVFEELCAIYEHGDVRIRKGDIVLDLGAHVGTFTRFALNHGAAKVIAIEPEPSHVACLKRSFVEELKRGSVHIIDAAAWRHEGCAPFRCEGVASRITESSSVSVSLTTVDKVVAELALDSVDFIKADIEGAERHALAGAANTIRRFGPRMAVCIYHFADDPRIIPRVVESIRPYSVSFNRAREQAFFWQ
jgi:FkbM family methyltransferase